MTEDPKRRRSGALVAAILLLGSGFGPFAALSRSNPSGPRSFKLSQVPPAPAASDSAAAGDPADDLSPVGGVATAAEAPPADATRGATTGPGATATPTARIPGAAIEQRGAAALALIDYPWTRTGYSIVFAGPNVGLLGLTDPPSKQITIYVRAGQSTRDIAWVLGHEIGHAVDFTMTTEAERAEYRRIRGLDSRPWYPTCQMCSDFASPVGDWAETFAFWLLGDGSFASQLAPRPTAAQLAALTTLFTADPEVATTPTTVRPSTATSPPTTTRSPITTVPPTTPPRSAPRPVPPRVTSPPRSRPPRPATTTTRPATTTTRPATTTTRPATTTTTAPTTTTTVRPTTTTTGPPTTTTGPTTTTSRGSGSL